MPSDDQYPPNPSSMGPSSLVPEEPTDRSRESLDTLMLGSLSTSIGIVVLFALLAGMVGRPVEGWNEAPIASGGRYYIPTPDCGIAAVVGEFLGLAGMALGQARRGATSKLSRLGTIICLVHMYLFLIYIML